MNYLGGYRNDGSRSPSPGSTSRPRRRWSSDAFWARVPRRSRRLRPGPHPADPHRPRRPATQRGGGRPAADHGEGPRRAQGRPRLRPTWSIELGLATIPGFFGAGGGPAPASPYGVYWPALVPADLVPHAGGRARRRAPPWSSAAEPARRRWPGRARRGPAVAGAGGATRRAPLGRGLRRPVGRQGRQRQPRRLRPHGRGATPGSTRFLTVERLQELLPETAAAARSSATAAQPAGRSTSWSTACSRRAWPPRPARTARPRAWASTCGPRSSTSRSPCSVDPTIRPGPHRSATLPVRQRQLRATPRRSQARRLDEPLDAGPLTPVGLEQPEHLGVVRSRSSAEQPADLSRQVEVPDEHGVGVTVAGLGDHRRRPRSDAAHRLQPPAHLGGTEWHGLPRSGRRPGPRRR